MNCSWKGLEKNLVKKANPFKPVSLLFDFQVHLQTVNRNDVTSNSFNVA